jgi:SAM-dependent methyltransferase
MKTLPKNLTGTNTIFYYMRSAIKAQAIISAVELGIFTYLEKEHSPEFLAKKLSLHLPSVKVFLEMLSTMGVLTKGENSFQNTPETTEMFLESSFANILPFLEAMRCGFLDTLPTLSKTLKTGPSRQMAESDDNFAGEQHPNEAEASACWAFRGVAPALAKELASLEGADSFKRMLDLGGGPGIFSLYAAQALPELRVDVLDLPAPLALAAKYAQEWQLSDRVRMVPRDYIQNNLEQGYDLVLASCTLNFTLPGNETASVVRKIYDSLNPEGYFVSLHDALPDPGPNKYENLINVPGYPLECLAAELFSGIKMSMPKGFIAQTMLQSGFRQVFSREFPTDGGLFSLDIGRKTASIYS